MRTVRIIAALFGLAGVVFMGSVLLISRSDFTIAPQREPLPILGEAPAIALNAQTAEAFSSDSLKGKVWVADFFFTSCAGPCPVMTTAMAGVQKAFPREARLHFVSISVDPDTDTPERLSEYGNKYGADFERWHFLTGPIEAIQKLAVDGFKVGSVDNPVIHSTRFILVDQQGRIRGYYLGVDEGEVLQMQEDIKQLLRGNAA